MVFIENGGRRECEVIGRKRGNGWEVPCAYKFIGSLSQNEIQELKKLGQKKALKYIHVS